MKHRLDYIVHGLIALAWISIALGISLKVALLGNESAGLAKQRGADFKIRTELAFKQDRLRAILDQATSPSSLEQAVRQLDLPIQPPVMTAGLPTRHATP